MGFGSGLQEAFEGFLEVEGLLGWLLVGLGNGCGFQVGDFLGGVFVVVHGGQSDDGLVGQGFGLAVGADFAEFDFQED